MSRQKRKKKHGMRKVKKNERMREDVLLRHEMAGPPKPGRDLGDVFPKRVGKGSDASRKKGT
jgi:hypothetical protein